MKAMVEALRERVERTYANDMALVARVAEILNRSDEHVSATVFSAAEYATKTQLQLVTETLEAAQGRPLAANEIAMATGMDAGAARMVLYGNKDKFKAQPIGPRRVKWTLAEDTTAVFSGRVVVTA